MGYFQDHSEDVVPRYRGWLVRDGSSGGDGLRRAQLGAAYALAAHFTTTREPGIVAMPTGSGKTAVITLLPFLLGSTRVLVVTPTRLLRDQLCDEFASLSILRRSGTLQQTAPPPRTKAITNRLATAEAWEELQDHDVVVGTPNVLSPAQSGVAAPGSAPFDLVIFDEAHHTPAPTYAALLEAHPNVPAALFTATPFRRDRASLPGRAVYTYSLGQALEDKILAPITFIPVEAPDGWSPEQKDLTLAEAAVERLRSPEHQAADSRLIARTSSVSHAKELLGIYRQAGADLGLIVAASSPTSVRATLRDLRDGKLQGVVSVGVLGEGFDFPRLKIAAYHRRHGSLPATLQFLGRISRLVPEGLAAELLALREEVNDETRELYASDVAWASLVPQIADAAVRAETERRQYLREFDPSPTEPLSLAALRPRKYVQVYNLYGATLDLSAKLAELGGGSVIYRGVDEDQRLCVVITEHLERPEWIDADTLDRYSYELHVIVVDERGTYAFVHGTRDATVRELLQIMGLQDSATVDPLWIDRLMSGVVLAEYHSVGMRSTRAAGGRLAAYRMMAGTNVGGAVLPSETRAYGTGHAIARVLDPVNITADMVEAGANPASARVTSLGVSYGRGTVFSPDLAQLLDFREWCQRLADIAYGRRNVSPSGLPNLHLLSARLLTEFPDNAYNILMEPTLYGIGIRIIDTASGQIWPVETMEFHIDQQGATELKIHAEVDAITVWRATLDASGQVIPVGRDLVVQEPNHHDTSFTDFLGSHPFTVFYATGESSMGRIRFQAREDYPDLTDRVLVAWTFVNDSVDILAEVKNQRQGYATIKDYTAVRLSQDLATDFVIDDDRAGEVADLVSIGRTTSGVARIGFYHCKASRKDYAGARVEDLYEVLGQAEKSVRWLDVPRLAKRLLDRISSGSRVVHGQTDDLIALLDTWVKTAPPASFIICTVQPGLAVARVNKIQNIKVVVNDALEWINQHDAEFLVVGQ